MRRDVMVAACLGGLLSIVVSATFPGAAAADDRGDTEKRERQLQRQTRRLDAEASRASETPDGQRRLTERIARQFNVDPSVVTELRNRKLGFGSATIALALSQELMKRDSSLDQQAALEAILAQRQAGKGWGVIAHEQGLKLGHVVSELKKAGTATERTAGRPATTARAERDDRTAKPEKIDRPAKLEKPEKIDKPARPDKPAR